MARQNFLKFLGHALGFGEWGANSRPEQRPFRVERQPIPQQAREALSRRQHGVRCLHVVAKRARRRDRGPKVAGYPFARYGGKRPVGQSLIFPASSKHQYCRFASSRDRFGTEGALTFSLLQLLNSCAMDSACWQTDIKAVKFVDFGPAASNKSAPLTTRRQTLRALPHIESGSC